MKIMKLAGLAVIVLVAVAAASTASAHGRHRSSVHFGFQFGAPAYWYPAPWYYRPAPYYYYPPVVTVPAAPTQYIERGDAYIPQDQQPGYWYYCPEVKTYYPYVQQCAGGWQRVNPTPPGG
jgi:hypothetical protein